MFSKLIIRPRTDCILCVNQTKNQIPVVKQMTPSGEEVLIKLRTIVGQQCRSEHVGLGFRTPECYAGASKVIVKRSEATDTLTDSML